MLFTAQVLAVPHPQKLIWLPPVLASIDNSSKFKFDRKTLAVDEVRGWKFPSRLKREIETKGWLVLIDDHMSRPKSMIHAMAETTEDVIFYHEDDVVVSLPAREKIEEIFNYTAPDGRTAGIVSLNIGGTAAWFNGTEGIGDLADLEQTTFMRWDDLICFARDEVCRDEHFFEFPGMFIRRDLLLACVEHSMKHHHKIQVEKAFTLSWFELGLYQKFFKCSIAKSGLIEGAKKEPKEIFNKWRLLSNLDPAQGCSAYQGSHAV